MTVRELLIEAADLLEILNDRGDGTADEVARLAAKLRLLARSRRIDTEEEV